MKSLTTAAPAPLTLSAALPWMLLPARLALFALFQLVIAGSLALGGASAPFEASTAWWPLAVTLANLACLGLLVGLFRQEGRSYWAIFRIDRAHLKADILVMLGVFVISGPVSFAPSVLLANALYGGMQQAGSLLIQPLPGWAVWASIVAFPITQGLAELGFYYALLLPRLVRQGVSGWAAVTVTACFLALQHAAAPLRLDSRFMLYRALAFLPFALLVGVLLKWRPRLLPYLAAFHVLMDFATAAMLLGA